MPVQVRQTDDLDLIVELDRVCFPLDAVVQHKELDDSVWWLATADGVAVGYAGLLVEADKKRSYLHRFGVLPDARGHGLQKRLIRTCVKASRRFLVERAYTYVHAANTPSLRAFVQCGFLPYFATHGDPTFVYLDFALVKGAKYDPSMDSK